MTLKKEEEPRGTRYFGRKYEKDKAKQRGMKVREMTRGTELNTDE